MAWLKVKKQNFSSNEPVISLNNNRFSYNVYFSKLAELEKNRFVKYFIDEENRKIGFEFYDNEVPDSFKVTGNSIKGRYSQSTELFSKTWIQKISKLNGINRFSPIVDGKKFIITLMPVFEIKVLKTDYLKINSEACGIYRYLDNGNIVYIGKGNIRSRLREISRKDWSFDTIEYSIVSSDTQFEWENYWISRFRVENENCLPAYNLISGKNY